MDTPEFFCVIFKKHAVERSAETVDIEILQRVFFAFDNAGIQIAESCFHCTDKSHVDKSFRFHGDRVIKELAQKENTADTGTDQGYFIRLLRVRAAFCERFFSAKHQVVLCRSTLQGHEFFPDVIDLFVF